MMSSNYSVGQIVLHWISAVVVSWVLLSGFYVAVFNVSAGIKDWVGVINVSLTVLYIPIFFLRLYFSFFHGFSLFSNKVSITRYLAFFVHKAVYLTLGVVLLTGVLMMDRSINLFDVLVIAQLQTDPVAIAWHARLHPQACVVLLILVAVHVGAVVKHEWCGRRVLKNMSFQRSIFK